MLVNEFGDKLTVFDSAPDSQISRATPQDLMFTGNQRVATNKKTGMGGPSDLDLGTSLTPYDLSQIEAETIYQMSWAAKRIVDIIIDDMFAAGRRWTSPDTGLNKAMEEAESDLGVWERIPNAIRAARIYGSALLIVCPTDGDFLSPLSPYEYWEGSIANLLAIDKHSLTIKEWEHEPSNPGYGTPAIYGWSKRVHSKNTGYRLTPKIPGKPDPTPNQIIDIHHSRVFRFDGLSPPTTEGWKSKTWAPNWGVSVMIPAIHDIKRDISIANGVGHLVGQASVIVHQIQDFRTYMSAKGMGREMPPAIPTPDSLGKERGRTISMYNTMYMDAEDAIHRMEANFNGLQNIQSQQIQRIASIAGIPISRFLGIPATGMNATGDGEARDWRITVEAYRKRSIDPILTRRLDIMIARHIGIEDPPTWEWNNLGEMTDQEKAQLAANDTSTIVGAYKGGLIDEDEARQRLSEMEFWPQLAPWSGPSIHDDYEMQQLQMTSEAIQVEKQKMEAAAMMAHLRSQGGSGGPGDDSEGEKKSLPPGSESENPDEGEKE